MAYLDMEGMEDMEAQEIVDMSDVQPNVVSPEIVNLDDMGQPVIPTEVVDMAGLGAAAPVRRKQMVPSRMMPQRMTQRQAAPNLIVQGLGAAPRVAAAGAATTLPVGTGINTPLGGGMLLEPLAVRRMTDGSYVALGRAAIQLRGHVRPGQRVTLVPSAR